MKKLILTTCILFLTTQASQSVVFTDMATDRTKRVSFLISQKNSPERNHEVTMPTGDRSMLADLQGYFEDLIHMIKEKSLGAAEVEIKADVETRPYQIARIHCEPDLVITEKTNYTKLNDGLLVILEKDPTAWKNMKCSIRPLRGGTLGSMF